MGAMQITMQTERLSLRTFDASDEVFINELERRPEVIDFIGTLPSRGPSVIRMFTVSDNGKRVGMVALIPSPAKERETDVGLLCAMTQEGEGKGRATEACRAVMQWAGGTGRWTRVLACVDLRNEPSRKLVMKLGFQLCGRRTTFGGQQEAVFAFELLS